MSCDLKYFLFETPMSRAEYMRIQSNYFPPDIIDRYDIEGLIPADGYVYIKIKKGNVWTEASSHYSLQSAHFRYGTAQILSSAPNNWTFGTKYHKNIFFLCVHDFGVKYFLKRVKYFPKMMQITS